MNELIGAYPSGWMWREEDFDLVKCLIPFFDGLAIFMPESLAQQVVDSDPYLAGPLFENGYLRNIDPDAILDRDLSNRVIEMVRMFVNDERFKLVGSQIKARPTLGHLGGYANPKEVLDFLNDLENQGHVRALGSDGIFETKSDVCTAIVQSCFWALGLQLRSRGVDLLPVAQSNPRLYRGRRFGNSQSGPNAIDDYIFGLLTGDLKEVGVDLRAVPLDEVLDFSDRYRSQYQAYMRGIRDTARAMLQADDLNEMDQIARDRRESLEDQRAFLQRSSRSEFRRRSLSLAVGILSSTWTLRSGDPVAAALGVAATAVGLAPSPDQPSAYSFLFGLRRLGRS
jgi:hypothetical protein